MTIVPNPQGRGVGNSNFLVLVLLHMPIQLSIFEMRKLGEFY